MNGERRRYCFVDSYDTFRVRVSIPTLVVSQTPPETDLDIAVVVVDERYLERWPQVRHRVKGAMRV